MRKLFGILLFVMCSLAVSAQQVHFIYLQTEDGHPFYLKMNSEIYSSSGSGYLIMPGLVDSTYTFSIGFPSSSNESRFTLPVSGKDRGFLVKVLDAKIALFDMQSLTLIRQRQDQGETLSYERRNDDFSSLLSKAAKDTSLLYAVVKNSRLPQQKAVEPEVPATAETEPPVKQDVAISDSLAQSGGAISSAAETHSSQGSESKLEGTGIQTDAGTALNPATDDVAAHDTAATLPLTDEVFSRSVITRHSESSTTEGFGLVFFDDYGTGVDTIQLIIPNQKLVFRHQPADTESKAVEFIEWSDAPADTADSRAKTIQPKEKTQRSTEIDSKSEQVSGTVEPKTDTPGQPGVTSAYKTECKTVATTRDFFRLRKDMAAEETDEGMVDEAKKYFKSKCFSTEQIKNLSALFLTSAGKYQFFDAAYFHVTDPQAFRQLASEIKDDYYLRRFQALIGE